MVALVTNCSQEQTPHTRDSEASCLVLIEDVFFALDRVKNEIRCLLEVCELIPVYSYPPIIQRMSLRIRGANAIEGGGDETTLDQRVNPLQPILILIMIDWKGWDALKVLNPINQYSILV